MGSVGYPVSLNVDCRDYIQGKGKAFFDWLSRGTDNSVLVGVTKGVQIHLSTQRVPQRGKE